MASLHNLQQNFMGYLLGGSASRIVENIVSTPQRSASQRMQFYGNAYRLRLKEALSTDYERLHAYLGDELFENLMDRYIDLYPSSHPSLRYFGAHMVELVSTAEPFIQWPEVTEIARIEQAFNNSFDASNTEIITLQQLQSLAPEAWTTFSLTFHDSVQLLPQQANSFQIWQALSEQHTPPEKTDDHSTWLIWRQDLVSRYRSLQQPELSALQTALCGGSFVDICEVLMTFYNEQETPQQAIGLLQQWIHDQMVCELSY